MTKNEVMQIILKKRNILESDYDAFLNPDYDLILTHDPFEITDMKKAVDRLKIAFNKQESVLIYGDYDADGVTSTSLLLDGFKMLGYENVSYVIPQRSVHGYGLNLDLIKKIDKKPDLIVTVDCGSMNHDEIDLINQMNIDVIVTDHHNIAKNQPKALAVVNPKRDSERSGFYHMSGVGVAFTLIRALQKELKTLKDGMEKWLLDLVAIGTVSDVMPLNKDNRILVYYGLKVLAKTKRAGLKMILKNNKISCDNLSSFVLGFTLGPRFNAAGRISTADLSVEILTSNIQEELKTKVDKLEFLNQKRKAIQEQIYQEAKKMATQIKDDVIVLYSPNWHEGVVGIVAAKIMEEFQKPTFVLTQNSEYIKGSARSFGEFSISEAINHCRDYIVGGGGHNAAGGVKLKNDQLELFIKEINKFYRQLKLKNQFEFLKTNPDVTLDNLELIDNDLFNSLQKLNPYGEENPEPIFRIKNLKIKNIKSLGSENQHLKLIASDGRKNMNFLYFNCPLKDKLFVDNIITIDVNLTLNSWQGRNDIEGRIINIVVEK